MGPVRVPSPDGGGAPDYQGEIARLQKAVADLQDGARSTGWGPFASTQPNGLSAQKFGNGTAQLVSPSFSAIAGGLTGLKIDDTGVSLFGKQIWTSPWTRDGELVAIKAEFPGVRDAVAATGRKLEVLKEELDGFGSAMKAASRQNRTVLGARGRAANSAELDALKRSVEQLAERLG